MLAIAPTQRKFQLLHHNATLVNGKGFSFYDSFFLNKVIYFIYFWLHWVFAAVRGLSLVDVSGGYSLLWCASLSWLLLLQSMGSRCVGFSSCGMRAQ